MRQIKNAIIKGVDISLYNSTMLVIWVNLDYGGVAQDFGGMKLGDVPSLTGANLCTNICGDFLAGVMEVAGADNLDKIKGQAVRVDADNSKVYGVGHVIKDIWYYPEDSEAFVLLR